MIRIFNNQLAGFLLFSGYQIAEIDGQPISKNCIYGFNKEPGIGRAIENYQEVKRERIKKT